MTAEPATRILDVAAEAISAAARCLAAGGLVAFPTETVYGLGADATNGEAVARLYMAKGRPSFNPLIAHVADLAAARRLAVFDANAERPAAPWPGPLTLMLLRPGGVPRAELERALGRPLIDAPQAAASAAVDEDAPLAPGMLASHYAPRARLRLDAEHVEPGEALLAFGPLLPSGAERAAAMRNLSTRGDLIEAAANLFSHLRALDAADIAAIAVMPVPQ